MSSQTFDAVIKLRKKVGNESILERNKADQTHRYFTVDHQMKIVFSKNTGEYLKKKEKNIISSSAKEKINEIFETSEESKKTQIEEN